MKRVYGYLSSIFIFAMIILFVSCNKQERKEAHEESTRKEILDKFPQAQKVVAITGEEGTNYIATDTMGNVKVYFWGSGYLNEKEVSDVK